MKKRYFYGLFLVAALAMLQITCKKPTTGITLTVSTNVLKYSVAMQFSDPANATGTMQGTVSVTITGADGSYIYNTLGTKNFTVTSDNLSLALGPGRTPLADAPVKFNVYATCPGYLPVNVPVTIYPNQTSQVLFVSMVNIAKPPSGVTVAIKHVALQGDSTSSPVTVPTTPSVSDPLIATVTIPTGTHFLDSNGNLITGGTVDITVAHFDPSNGLALSCFPGGGNVNPTGIMRNGVLEDGGFMMSTGFADITMVIGGVEVKKFDKDVMISFTADPTVGNPENGHSTISAGDSTDVYSFQTGTGTWTYEGRAGFTGTTPLGASFPTRHLTVFNIAFLGKKCPTSTNSIIYHRTGVTQPENFYVRYYNNGWGNYPIYQGFKNLADGSIDYMSPPKNTTIEIQVFPSIFTDGTAVTASLCN